MHGIRVFLWVFYFTGKFAAKAFSLIFALHFKKWVYIVKPWFSGI
jgi:hypothetical protein